MVKKPQKTYETNICAFTRSVDPSIGIMRAFTKEDKLGEPVMVRRESFLGQVSPSKPSKGKENPGAVFIGEGDIARLPDDKDYLRISGGVRFLNNSLKPTMCDNDFFRQAVSELAERAVMSDDGGENVYDKIANRYLWNIMNGRVVWRNRFLSANQRVIISLNGGGEEKIVANPLAYDLISPPVHINDLTHGLVEKTYEEALKKIRDKVSASLSGIGEITDLRFDWEADVGAGSVVYPSQAMKEGKVLMNVDGKVFITDQKIGAALRYFDDWHGQGGVAPVNPYAGDKMTGEVHRNNKTNLHKKQNPSLYELLTSPEFMTGEIEYEDSLPPDTGIKNLMFVISCFIRGGLFQTKGTDSKEATIVEGNDNQDGYDG